VGERRRPNMPGVVDRPNWSRALPVTVEELDAHPLVADVAATLNRAVVPTDPSKEKQR